MFLFCLPKKRTQKKAPPIDIQPDWRIQHCAAAVQSSLYIIAMTVDCIDPTTAFYILGWWKDRNILL
jgi:hypothetical protein